MQDNMLEELVAEVNRCNTIFNESTGPAIIPVALELKAAEERLYQYISERKDEFRTKRIEINI